MDGKYTIRHGEHTFLVQFQPVDWTTPFVVPRKDGKWLVGYLAHDENAESPLASFNCNGMIYDRRPEHGTAYEFWQHVNSDPVKHWMSEQVRSSMYWHPYLSVLLDVYVHSCEVWRVTNSGKAFPDERWDVLFAAGIWVPDNCCKEDINILAWKSLVGSKDLHTLCDLKAEAARRSLNISKTELRAARRKAAIDMATSAVADWSEWSAGNCYGVCLEWFDAQKTCVSSEDDWGYIGAQHALDGLTDAMRQRV